MYTLCNQYYTINENGIYNPELDNEMITNTSPSVTTRPTFIDLSSGSSAESRYEEGKNVFSNWSFSKIYEKDGRPVYTIKSVLSKCDTTRPDMYIKLASDAPISAFNNDNIKCKTDYGKDTYTLFGKTMSIDSTQYNYKCPINYPKCDFSGYENSSVPQDLTGQSFDDLLGSCKKPTMYKYSLTETLDVNDDTMLWYITQAPAPYSSKFLIECKANGSFFAIIYSDDYEYESVILDLNLFKYEYVFGLIDKEYINYEFAAWNLGIKYSDVDPFEIYGKLSSINIQLSPLSEYNNSSNNSGNNSGNIYLKEKIVGNDVVSNTNSTIASNETSTGSDNSDGNYKYGNYSIKVDDTSVSFIGNKVETGETITIWKKTFLKSNSDDKLSSLQLDTNGSLKVISKNRSYVLFSNSNFGKYEFGLNKNGPYIHDKTNDKLLWSPLKEIVDYMYANNISDLSNMDTYFLNLEKVGGLTTSSIDYLNYFAVQEAFTNKHSKNTTNMKIRKRIHEKRQDYKNKFMDKEDENFYELIDPKKDTYSQYMSIQYNTPDKYNICKKEKKNPIKIKVNKKNIKNKMEDNRIEHFTSVSCTDILDTCIIRNNYSENAEAPETTEDDTCNLVDIQESRIDKYATLIKAVLDPTSYSDTIESFENIADGVVFTYSDDDLGKNTCPYKNQFVLDGKCYDYFNTFKKDTYLSTANNFTFTLNFAFTYLIIKIILGIIICALYWVTTSEPSLVIKIFKTLCVFVFSEAYTIYYIYKYFFEKNMI